MQRKLFQLSIDRRKHFSIISSTFSEPIKTFLNSYPIHQNKIGYNNGENISLTLQNFSRLVHIQGKNPQTFGDFNYYEACASPQLKAILNDFQYSLQGKDIFFAPLHLANSLQALQDLGYRNTQIYKKIWHRLLDEVLDSKTQYVKTAEELFDQANKGGEQKWRSPGYYIYKGFEDNQSFNSMYQILMKWKCDKIPESKVYKEPKGQQSTLQQDEEEYNHIVKQLEKISKLSIDTKSMQSKLLNSLTDLRRQYFKVISELDKRKFLRENPYIFYDILELQQQLVEAGIIQPEDLLNSQSYFQNFQARMKKAADSFYQLAGLVFPQALSPNIDQFYEAAIQTPNKDGKRSEKPIDLKESNNHFTPKILARCLESLASMAYSTRQDVAQTDDKNGRVAKILPPTSNYSKIRAQMKQDRNLLKNQELNTSILPPHFTSMWQIMQQKFLQIHPVVLNHVKNQKCDLETLLRFSSAFGKARIGKITELNREIKKKINSFSIRELKSNWNSILQRLGYKQSSRLLVNFINNRLSSDIESRNIERIGVQIIWNKYQKDVDGDNLFDPQSAINLAWAYSASQFKSTPNLASKKHVQFNKSLFISLVSFLNRSHLLDAESGKPGECLNNEAKIRKINEVVSMLEALFEKQLIEKYASNLVNARENIVEINKLYEGVYNPIKDKVTRYVKRLLEDRMHFSKDKKSLIESWSYQSMMQNKYAGIVPDFVSGYKGNKIGVFIIDEQHCMSDTHELTGETFHKFKQLMEIDKEMKCIAIPLNEIVKIDIKNFSVKYNENFRLLQHIDKQVTSNRPDLYNLTKFFDVFIKKINSVAGILNQSTSQFAKGIYNVLRAKEISESMPSKLTRASTLNDLKLQIGKLSLLLPSLPNQINLQVKQIIKQLTNSQLTPPTFFLNQIQKIDQFLKQNLTTNKKSENQKELDTISNKWIGRRLGVQLPSKKKNKKLIEKQLLNYGNMLIESYCPYLDWHQQIQNSYDKLNYMVRPSLKSEELFLTHHFKFPNCGTGQTCMRKVPYGIFPDPNRKRSPISPPDCIFSNQNTTTMKQSLSNASVQSYFVSQPFKYMLMRDRIDSANKKVTDETLLMVSLLNFRNALKKNCRDQEILDKVLRFDFYGQLIDEHLKQHHQQSKNDKRKNIKYLTRNAIEFRLFQQNMKNVVNSKLDNYSDFFLKEAGKREYQNVLKSKIEGELKNHKVSKSKIQEKLEDYYMKLESLDRDNYSVSLIRQEESVVKYNLQSLLKPINRRTLSEDVIQEVYGKGNLTDQMYLNISRRYSEMKLIKAKILHKLYASEKLTGSEHEYLKRWKTSIKEIVEGKSQKSLRSLHFTMMPEIETSLTIEDINDQDIERFSMYPLVGLKNQAFADYSLSQLCLQLANFINSGTLKRVEIEFLGEMMRNSWKLDKKYQVCDARNYEVDLIMNQMEERVWRDAGRFNDIDYENVKKMTNIKRGSGDVDRVFTNLDQQSLKSFMLDNVNNFDDRVNILFKWLTRKEEQIYRRVRTPPPDYQKSDQELFKIQQSMNQKGRENLLESVYKKKYQDITGLQLNQLVVRFCQRLELMSYQYPDSLIQLIRGIWNAPQLLSEDRDLLEIYCEYYELDWKEDDQRFLYESPVFLKGAQCEGLNNLDEVKDRLKVANNKFIDTIKMKVNSLRL